MAFSEVRTIINHYSLRLTRFGDVRIYKMAIKLLGSTEQADKFMLSEYGGYELIDLYKIKQKIDYEYARIYK